MPRFRGGALTRTRATRLNTGVEKRSITEYNGGNGVFAQGGGRIEGGKSISPYLSVNIR